MNKHSIMHGLKAVGTTMFLLFFCAILTQAGTLNAEQQNTIKGTVVDTQGEPLPGVTITIEGTTRGVITDIDGSYSISANPTDKLIFSFVGMESQTVEVGNQRTINITMSEKIDELDEVTVVAFGRQKKESVISSITTVNAKDLTVPTHYKYTIFN